MDRDGQACQRGQPLWGRAGKIWLPETLSFED
jgi:hypothetical protein